MTARDRELPIVYSCSGCSSAAQMANHVAVGLDRAGHAEMSCIAGVGGDVPPLVRIARSGRTIVAIDGCALHCVANCLGRHGVSADLHFTLTSMGIRKRIRTAFSEDEAAGIFRQIVGALRADDTGDPDTAAGTGTGG